LLTESLLVGLLGGVVGLLLATWGIHVLLSMAPSGIPRLETIGLDPVVLAFALGTSTLTGLAFGSIPALRLRTSDLVEPLKEGGRGSGGGVRRLRFRTVFGVFQVALALVLLVASGLMLRSFQALLRVSPGFEGPEEVLTMRVAVPPTEEPDVDQATRIQQTILERIAHLPGVSSVSGATSVAMEDWASWDDWTVEEFPLAEGEVPPEIRINWMVPGYHGTIRNRRLAGRSLEWEDIYRRRNVAVITENFAREYWGEPAGALGKRVRNSENGPWREIIGVVGNVHTRGVANEAPHVIYLPYITADFWGSEAFSFGELRYVIRTERPDPLSLVPEVRQTVWAVHPNLAISEVSTLDQIFHRSISRTSFTLVMLGIAALVALMLGMVGVYGVISYLVAQRTREMGVRLAIGASQVQVRDLVLRQGVVFAVAGVTVGLAVAAGLTRFLGSLLFGVTPVDGTTYGTVSVVLVAVVFLASYLPARRAARVDPVVALRAE
jgi:predicted permease